MPQSLSKILIHIVFATKKRQQWLDREICAELYPYIAQTLKNNGCYNYKIGGIPDHIHILCSLSKTIRASKIIEKIKTSTSKWIKIKNQKFVNFQWQNGYAVFSISSSHLEIVTNYISNQTKHHKKITFEDEFRNLLNKYKITYDERYLWD